MNAKDEFLEKTKDYRVICATVRYNDDAHVLHAGYTPEQYASFLESIDFEYDESYGAQNLYGEICCQNGVWFDRGEYDGSEWWEKHKYPNLW